jgi:hypothetical protein
LGTSLVGLFSPVYAQIDPVKLGEIQRAIAIAQAYGIRLNNAYDRNLLEGGLEHLIVGYPSHGFVIDRKEAKALFRRVRHPEQAENLLGEFLCASYPLKEENTVFDLIDHFLRGEDNERGEFEGDIATITTENSAGALGAESEDGRADEENDREPKEIFAPEDRQIGMS